MIKKIIITGGLGYIGTELCKIYSGYSWKNKIIVIDNRFISERVNQLRNWNIEFIHGDILNKELIGKYCSDADIIHHLAGITDVPRTKNENNKIADKNIKLVAIEGTQNILNAINKDCKIIFPSTHVVYEGIEKIKNNIFEDDELRPVLSILHLKQIMNNKLKVRGKIL
jgi:UDP-glucose 4-epimerase